MSGLIYRRAAQSFLAAIAACCIPLAAQAGTINIILSDMDVLYMGSTSGGSLFDAMGGFAGGSLVEATSDDITTAYFEMDDLPANGTPAASTLINSAANGDDLHVDFRITNIGPTVPKNVFLPAVGNNNFQFGLDFFTDAGQLLRLLTDEVSLRISNNVFQFDGTAQLSAQNLPFGLVMDPTQPVVFSFSATLPAVPPGGNGSPMPMAVGSGALTISGIMIPEPAAYALLCSGLLALSIGVARRPRRDAFGLLPLHRS